MYIRFQMDNLHLYFYTSKQQQQDSSEQELTFPETILSLVLNFILFIG